MDIGFSRAARPLRRLLQGSRLLRRFLKKINKCLFNSWNKERSKWRVFWNIIWYLEIGSTFSNVLLACLKRSVSIMRKCREPNFVLTENLGLCFVKNLRLFPIFVFFASAPRETTWNQLTRSSRIFSERHLEHMSCFRGAESGVLWSSRAGISNVDLCQLLTIFGSICCWETYLCVVSVQDRICTSSSNFGGF